MRVFNIKGSAQSIDLRIPGTSINAKYFLAVQSVAVDNKPILPRSVYVISRNIKQLQFNSQGREHFEEVPLGNFNVKGWENTENAEHFLPKFAFNQALAFFPIRDPSYINFQVLNLNTSLYLGNVECYLTVILKEEIDGDHPSV